MTRYSTNNQLTLPGASKQMSEIRPHESGNMVSKKMSRNLESRGKTAVLSTASVAKDFNQSGPVDKEMKPSSRGVLSPYQIREKNYQ